MHAVQVEILHFSALCAQKIMIPFTSVVEENKNVNVKEENQSNLPRDISQTTARKSLALDLILETSFLLN